MSILQIISLIKDSLQPEIHVFMATSLGTNANVVMRFTELSVVC